MRTQVSPEEVGFYRENGFVILDEVLNPAELEQWRAVVTDAVESRSEMFPGMSSSSGSAAELQQDIEAMLRRPDLPAHARKAYTALKERPIQEVMENYVEYYQTVFVQRLNLWKTSPAVRELVLDSRIGRLAAELAGVDGIRLFHDQALFKQPWGSPTSWHTDLPYWSFANPAALSMWIALDDATPQNGCLSFIPGSQRVQRYETPSIGKDLGALFVSFPEWADIEPAVAAMPAGSASFHNAFTAHGAGANMTNRPRRAMTLQFMPMGSTYNGRPNVALPPEYLETLTVGDELRDNDVNPLLWSR
ncbi:hypothetical protein GCM10009804_74540 [Kribbella hippodromi]|uniref:Phytanoyl-CoA dioxygenase family protein n=1 Tax=Kribbella hippodromi TaxID=434347 RepID=A0ABN2EHK5_9ACTN